MYAVIKREHLEWLKARPSLVYHSAHEITLAVAELRARGVGDPADFVVVSIRPSGAVEEVCSASEWREPDILTVDHVDAPPPR